MKGKLGAARCGLEVQNQILNCTLKHNESTKLQ